MLASRGYDPGPADGLFGPRTARAISRYQQDSGIPVDGLATPALLRHLQGQPTAAPKVLPVAPALGAGHYEVGERYVFDGGITHDVVGAEAGQVEWQTSPGRRYKTPPHVGQPETEWHYGDWTGRNESSLPVDSPWPPPRGRGATFDVRSEEWHAGAGAADRFATDSQWVCRNEGPSATETPAGRFDVQLIACERWPAPAGEWQRRVWYIAPKLGHFVRRDDLDSAGQSLGRLELVAALPGGGAPVQNGLAAALRDALDNRAVGETAFWRDPSGGGYMIAIKRKFTDGAGRTCRAYDIRRAGRAGGREFPAVSCYEPARKRWRIPGLS